jgi:hypothetical protein
VWTKATNEDDKAFEFTDKFIAVEEYQNFTYEEGIIIVKYANQLQEDSIRWSDSPSSSRSNVYCYHETQGATQELSY